MPAPPRSSSPCPSITTVIGQQPHGLDGWFGYMGANSLAQDPTLPGILGSPAKVRQAVSRAAKAAETYRDDAAKRGDRVHNYCEQVALRALGRPHQMKETREALAANGEEAFAARFDEWWELFQVEPIAPEITVWNKTVGYAGTLDLVAKINGRTCLIDYKTKGTSRDGTVKPLDDKVVMQLVAGMKAEESLVDPVAGEWEAWQHGESPILLAVAIGADGSPPAARQPGRPEASLVEVLRPAARLGNVRRHHGRRNGAAPAGPAARHPVGRTRSARRAGWRGSRTAADSCAVLAESQSLPRHRRPRQPERQFHLLFRAPAPLPAGHCCADVRVPLHRLQPRPASVTSGLCIAPMPRRVARARCTALFTACRAARFRVARPRRTAGLPPVGVEPSSPRRR